MEKETEKLNAYRLVSTLLMKYLALRMSYLLTANSNTSTSHGGHRNPAAVQSQPNFRIKQV
jgi:hypothetical protein